MNLAEVNSGETCIVKGLSAKGALLQKLLDMGFIVNSKIEVLRHAPLYDPMELIIQNYTISLRKSEAELVEVELS